MKESLSQLIRDALAALSSGKPVAILDSASREGETDLFFPAIGLSPQSLRTLRTQAGGELYISIGNEVAKGFGLPFIGQALNVTEIVNTWAAPGHMSKIRTKGMCQGSCSVGMSLDHRSTHTGAPDDERSLTCRRLAELWVECQKPAVPPLTVEEAAKKLGEEFHTPGHIFLCIENEDGLKERQGHTELSVALAKLAEIPPLMVGCVMLSNSGDNYGALPPEEAKTWAQDHGVTFLEGRDILDYAMQETL